MIQTAEVLAEGIHKALERLEPNRRLRTPWDHKDHLKNRQLPITIVLAAAALRAEAVSVIPIRVEERVALAWGVDLMTWDACYKEVTQVLGEDQAQQGFEPLKLSDEAVEVLQADPPQYYQAAQEILQLACNQDEALHIAIKHTVKP